MGIMLKTRWNLIMKVTCISVWVILPESLQVMRQLMNEKATNIVMLSVPLPIPMTIGGKSFEYIPSQMALISFLIIIFFQKMARKEGRKFISWVAEIPTVSLLILLVIIFFGGI